MQKQKYFKKKRSIEKIKVCLVKEWGYPSDKNNVFKGVSTSIFAKGDFRLAYKGKLRVLMGCFIRLTCKKKTKNRVVFFFD